LSNTLSHKVRDWNHGEAMVDGKVEVTPDLYRIIVAHAQQLWAEKYPQLPLVIIHVPRTISVNHILPVKVKEPSWPSPAPSPARR